MQKKDITPLVTIRCLVFNHEQYIRDCLEGFVMQQTNFRFEAVVHDDASTDGTAAIIAEFAEKYPDIIKPIYESENQYSKRDGSLRRIMSAHMRGEYIAMCEGDDYWTDPLKLQKQVDFLESHPEYGVVYSQVKDYEQRSGEFSEGFAYEISGESSREQLEDLMISGNRVPTLTTLYRKEFDAKMLQMRKENPYTNSWLMGDYPLWMLILESHKAYFMDEVMGVYRRLDNSASNFGTNMRKKFNFISSTYDICSFFNVRNGLRREEELFVAYVKAILLQFDLERDAAFFPRMMVGSLAIYHASCGLRWELTEQERERLVGNMQDIVAAYSRFEIELERAAELLQLGDLHTMSSNDLAKLIKRRSLAEYIYRRSEKRDGAQKVVSYHLFTFIPILRKSYSPTLRESFILGVRVSRKSL